MQNYKYIYVIKFMLCVIQFILAAPGGEENWTNATRPHFHKSSSKWTRENKSNTELSNEKEPTFNMGSPCLLNKGKWQDHVTGKKSSVNKNQSEDSGTYWANQWKKASKSAKSINKHVGGSASGWNRDLQRNATSDMNMDEMSTNFGNWRRVGDQIFEKDNKPSRDNSDSVKIGWQYSWGNNMMQSNANEDSDDSNSDGDSSNDNKKGDTDPLSITRFNNAGNTNNQQRKDATAANYTKINIGSFKPTDLNLVQVCDFSCSENDKIQLTADINMLEQQIQDKHDNIKVILARAEQGKDYLAREQKALKDLQQQLYSKKMKLNMCLYGKCNNTSWNDFMLAQENDEQDQNQVQVRKGQDFSYKPTKQKTLQSDHAPMNLKPASKAEKFVENVKAFVYAQYDHKICNNTKQVLRLIYAEFQGDREGMYLFLAHVMHNTNGFTTSSTTLSERKNKWIPRAMGILSGKPAYFLIAKILNDKDILDRPEDLKEMTLRATMVATVYWRTVIGKCDKSIKGSFKILYPEAYMKLKCDQETACAYRNLQSLHADLVCAFKRQ
ncbi:hypothetical protein COBT_001037 [Conglomerata obtusa]